MTRDTLGKNILRICIMLLQRFGLHLEYQFWGEAINRTVVEVRVKNLKNGKIEGELINSERIQCKN